MIRELNPDFKQLLSINARAVIVTSRSDPPASLWARRSWFAIDGDRLLVQEVFLPESHS